MHHLVFSIVQIPATLSGGLGDLALGCVLMVLAVVLYQVAPRLEEGAQRAWYPNRQAEGRRLRIVGQPVVVAGFGGLCLLAGMLHLA
jgi:hypothetical protein